MVEQIKSENDQNISVDTNGPRKKNIQNLILPNMTKWTMSKFNKEKKKPFSLD